MEKNQNQHLKCVIALDCIPQNVTLRMWQSLSSCHGFFG